MIEFTEGDRAKLIGLAHVIEHPDPEGVDGPDFAPSDARFLRSLAERPAGDTEGLREWLRSDEAVELTAGHLSPYVGEALVGVRREAPHILDLYRERARSLLAALADHSTHPDPKTLKPWPDEDEAASLNRRAKHFEGSTEPDPEARSDR